MSESTSVEEYAHFFEVRLDLFDGPIDLLLHLVKSRELPIEQVSLAEVTGQYLKCIEDARAYDLEVAAEYLVIAATLLSIKSSILLNQPIELVEDEDGNLTNPHEELLRRLREAEVYKQGAFELSCRKLYGVDVFSSPSLLATIEPPPIKYKQHDPMLLGIAFKKLLDRAPHELAFTITLDSVSVVQRMMMIVDQLKQHSLKQHELKQHYSAVPFVQLVQDPTNRASIISTFIALLELMKRQAIFVKQDQIFDEIVIGLASEDLDRSSLRSEFDGPLDQDDSSQATG